VSPSRVDERAVDVVLDAVGQIGRDVADIERGRGGVGHGVSVGCGFVAAGLEERVERAQAVVAGEHLDLVGIRRCG
jgi:hypothetical protein